MNTTKPEISPGRNISGADGVPIVTDKGYGAIRREYDSEGRVICEKYFGTDDAPMALEDGTAICRYEYGDGNEKPTVRRYDLQDWENEDEPQE